MTSRSLLAHVLFPAAFCLACSAPDAGAGAADSASAKAQTDGAAKAAPAKAPAKKVRGGFDAGAPVDYARLLRKTPDQVKEVLGAPNKEGGGRISCIRFVPNRVRFACEHSENEYLHPKFAKVSVHFEDGLSSAIEVEGFVDGEGSFNVDAAMKLAGVSTAKPPRRQPTEGAEVWVWFNNEARILVEDSQYLLRLSSIEKDWRRSKLEIIYNNPLTDDEKSRVKGSPAAPAAPAAAPAAAPDSPEAKKKALR